MQIAQAMKRILFVYAMAWGHFAFAGMEFIPLQEKAQGQSLTGASVLNESLHSNPAGAAFSSTYSLDGSLLFPRTFAVSVLDTRTGAIGGGIGYFRNSLKSGQVVQGGKLGLSGKVSQTVGLGMTGKMIWGPNSTGGGDRLGDIDVGTLFNFRPITMGAVIRSVFGGNTGMGYEREWAVGARYSWQDVFNVSAAVSGNWRNFSPAQLSGGVEYLSPYYFGLRVGYRHLPSLRTGYWSAGTSFNSPRMSLHYAVEFSQAAGEGLEHFVGLTMVM